MLICQNTPPSKKISPPEWDQLRWTQWPSVTPFAPPALDSVYKVPTPLISAPITPRVMAAPQIKRQARVNDG